MAKMLTMVGVQKMRPWQGADRAPRQRLPWAGAHHPAERVQELADAVPPA